MAISRSSPNDFSPLSYALLGIGLIVVVYPLATTVYNLYFHPLSKFPGPRLWAATRLTYVISLVKGDIVHDVKRLHHKYGEIVRTAPDELSFANPAALQDIFVHKPGQTLFHKNQKFVAPPPGQGHSMVTIPSEAEHTRMRRTLNYAFTEKALKSQEGIILSYVHELVDRLLDIIADREHQPGEGTIVNMVDWYNFFYFDVIGDLGFGESFDCLRDGAYHRWVSMVFDYMKGLTLAAGTRYWPPLEKLLTKMMPASIVKSQQDHFQLAVDKMNRRMNLEKERDDFVSHVMKRNKDFKEMSLEEMQTTFAMLIIAGSETTAAVTAGMTNYLVQSPEKLQKLVDEVRNKFSKSSEINMEAVKEMPYLNACVSEALRMCNPVPSGLSRVVPVEGGTVLGHSLPGSTYVSVNASTVNRDPKLFARPDEFIPERWFEPPHRPTEFNTDQRSVVHTFSLGPRGCIGKTMAWAEMRLVLANLVWALDFEPAYQGQGLDWASLKSYLVVEKQPVEVRIRVRK